MTFFLFASVVFGSTVFILLLVPETKGKEPAQIAGEIRSCDCWPDYSELLLDEGPDIDHSSSDTPRLQREDYGGKLL